MSTPPVARVQDLGEYVGQTVTLRGWLYNKSSKGKLHFLQFRDGSGVVQCVVFAKAVDPDVFDAIGRLGQESSLSVTGEVKADERAPGGFEVSVSGVEIHQAVEGYPITPKEHGVDFLLSRRHLWMRSRKQWAVLRLRDGIITGLRNFFDQEAFVCLDSPIFTPNACEGTSTLFEVGYFDRKAYLTQSGQLYAEAAAMAFGKVYCFGPTFRAEKSKTRRHLTEFWMLEPEIAYANLDDVISLAERMVTHVVAHVLEHRRTELDVLERDISKLEAIQAPFPRITYEAASKILLEHPESNFVAGDDFGAPDETIISSAYDRPVFVTHYPAAIKSFYMKRDPESPEHSLCVDMLGTEGVGELIGGSLREDDLETLEAAIARNELPQEAFAWYLDLRRYGTVPHGGFGLGLERFVAWIAGISHIREAIPFPRMMERLEP